MTALPLRYPILALVPDYEPDLVVGREQLEVHFNEDWFTAVPVWHLKKGTRAGVLLVDLEGRNWRIAKVSDQGAIGETFWKRIFGRVRRVQFDLSEEPPVSFDELKGRVCNSIQANSVVGWCRQPAYGAPGWPPRDRGDVLVEFQEKIRAANSMLELIAVLYFQPFQ